MKTFDPVNTPLVGTNLIEASAGTGKTYTIAGLFLRLILEQKLSADQILVVTFTKAATEELKDRIRNKLLQAKSAFLRGKSDDIHIDALVKKLDNTALAVQLIQDTLVDFDNAAIFTIHGFCKRILHENAFETNSLFDTELMADQHGLFQEVSDDFWREHFYSLPPEFVGYAAKNVSGPEDFVKLLAKKTAPDIKIIPELKKPSMENLDDFRAIFHKLKTAWLLSRKEVTKLLKNPSLSGTVYGSLKKQGIKTDFSKRDLKVLSMIEAMDRFTDVKSIGFPLFKDFERYTTTKLTKSVKKNHLPPLHGFFDICDVLYQKGAALESEMETYLLYLKTLFFDFARTRLLARKKNSNIQFFDDLLIMVKNALEGKGGKELATAIRQKYKAALVDEFQDTDSVQYEIFTRLFATKQKALFMIGDPKQAIFGFRGADIYSYLKAARSVDSKYTLIENWRSKPGLISAINTIFSDVEAPFVFDEIRFEKGTPGEKIESTDEKPSAPLTIWYLESKKGSDKPKPLSKTEAVPLIAKAVAGEISRLILPDKSDLSLHGANDVKAGDIAVLVRTNRQAQIIKQSLSSKRIPSVLYFAGNIFHTHEALEMERILWSLSEPSNERLFKAALATDIIGVTGYELDSKENEPIWWENRSGSWREFYRLWNRYGFIRMFRMFMAEEKVRERLLAFPDGDRRLTNALHLAEILHQVSIEKNLGMTGLLKWLSEQRHTAITESEVHQLRLESDDNAVKIITIHKSKGLEYPVVFCPFAWDGSLIQEQEIRFHNIDQNSELTLDLGSSERRIHVDLAQNELLAENLRLLYVALTRAIKRCYLVWGRFSNAETSALAFLFHYRSDPKGISEKKDLVTSLKSSFSTKKDDELLDDLRQLVSKSEGTIGIAPLPLDTGGEYVTRNDIKEKSTCRKFSGKIDTLWKISSYSSMISQRALKEALPDRDALLDVDRYTPEHPGDIYERTDIFSFPKGTRAGVFFHDLFEHLDFAAVDSEHKKRLVLGKLNGYGFDPKWQTPICTMINKVLSMPLEVNQTELTLSSVQCKDRINEMEFYFPLKPITPKKLEKIFADHGGIDLPAGFPDRIGKLTFPLAKGFMKGYIDMVFHNKGRYYLVDWKSNYLGSHVEDYDVDALNQTMTNDFYILQYHLYTLALHQYLRLRQPGYHYETTFGGIFYLFIRGIDPGLDQEYGIYKDFPNKDLINALGEALIPGY